MPQVAKKQDKLPKKQSSLPKKEKLQKQDDKKQLKKASDSSSSKSKVSKKGGALMSDVQNLAVPFAILLAKEGLSKMFKDDKKSVAPKTASKASSLRRRSTMAGGSCNLGCAAQTGGQAAKQLFQLQQEIDSFLEKY